jgi:hypothetical protein
MVQCANLIDDCGTARYPALTHHAVVVDHRGVPAVQGEAPIPASGIFKGRVSRDLLRKSVRSAGWVNAGRAAW